MRVTQWKAKIYSDEGADELVFLDIFQQRKNKENLD
jgi:imidazole glycerol phosphate synthase subunit HisF